MMIASMEKIITENTIRNRTEWINKIQRFNGDFQKDIDLLQSQLETEVNEQGLSALIDHLRLCGCIPELYRPDSTQEKVYSKYTDCLLSLSFKFLGMNSLLIMQRGDAGDVDVYAKDYSFIADAKAFRLSRTAKNQKDFKIQAMQKWKGNKPFAMVVCPIYQLPKNSSQIYHQAIISKVCIFTYSHLSLLLNYSAVEGVENAQLLLKEIFEVIGLQNPAKDAIGYWLAINRLTIGYSKVMENLWQIEKEAIPFAIEQAKKEAIHFLIQERESIMRMTHEEALKGLINAYGIDNKIKTINKISDNGLFILKNN
jgi:hypothetical protein